jgi:hypothetical protein
MARTDIMHASAPKILAYRTSSDDDDPDILETGFVIKAGQRSTAVGGATRLRGRLIIESIFWPNYRWGSRKKSS